MAKTMVFIDSRVSDLDLLVSQFAAGTEYKILDASYDGLLQMEESLAGKSDYSSIQIISHGAAGAITIGSALLNSNNLLQYQSQLDNIGHALTDSGDLLLYGCSVGAGASGQHFVETLAQLTGADVAASDDVTGGVAVGGDWRLEVTSGSIESKMPVAVPALLQYNHTLDYSEEYLLAEMSLVAYYDDPANPAEKESNNKAIAEAVWSDLRTNGWHILDQYPNRDFAVTAFENGDTIVIAYRGTDGFWGNGDWTGANAAIAAPYSAWNYQFDDAINYAKSILEDHPDSRILVTGHSLGGALAQVVSQMFKLDGATFDPGGALNIVASDEFNAKVIELRNDSKIQKLITDYPNYSINNGPDASFTNYTVEHSLVSNWIPDHIGTIHPIDFFAYASGEEIVIKTATFIASYALESVGADPRIADLTASLVLTSQLHSMFGILDLMAIEKYQEISANLKQQMKEISDLYATTGDLGVSHTPYQGEIEFHSSDQNPYLFANNSDNIIYGSAGNDVIYSFEGNDTVYGGGGNDLISTAQGNDVIETGGGSDTIYAGSGDDNIHIDGGTGGVIDAGSGNDTISISRYVTGYYTIDGGDGFESIDIDLTGFSYGFRWRYSSYFYELNSYSSYSTIHDVLISGIDKLQCYTDYYGSGYSGISIKNIEQYDITGTDGNDLLFYAGGTRYIGGKGTDTFYWDLSAATEAIVWDNDPSKTTMVQGVELSGLERLLIVTGSGDDLIKNTRVTIDDYIDTGAGNDTIDAGGGSDTMIGGLGNDFYAVDSTGDVVTELASEGIDTVQSTISYTLGANLENLILSGVSAINGTGNAAANTLVGNNGNNSMSGGEGDDTIYGGEGSDTAIFTGHFVDYVIDYNAGTSAYTVVDKIANRDGTDIISSIENFQFADGTKIMTSSIVDVVEPTVLSFTPPDGIDSVALGSNIVLVFSEAIKSGVGTIAIHSGSTTGPVVESYDTATSANLTISGATLTINPTSDLTNGTHYFITLDAGSVKDIAGNSFAGTDAYDFTTAAAASLHDLQGSATFWKTGLPITAITSTLASAPAVAGTQPIEFRNIQTAADGTRTLEIWETSPTAAINSILLDLALPTGSTATWQDATGLPSGWNSSANTDKLGQFILGGIGTTALSPGSVKLGTLTFSAPTNPQHFELSLTTGQLGNDTIPAFGLSSDSMTTGTDGLYQHLAMADGTYSLTSAKVPGTAESNAVKANDALAALKIAVGMNPNADGSAVSPYQYLAADINKDGQVKAADALNILKMAVKLSSAPEMEWLFVPESVGNESMSRTHVVWPDNPIPVTLDIDQDVHLIGIVTGDVDGSWAA